MNDNEFTVKIDDKDVVFKVLNPSFKSQGNHKRFIIRPLAMLLIQVVSLGLG